MQTPVRNVRLDFERQDRVTRAFLRHRFWPVCGDVSVRWQEIATVFIDKRRQKIDAGWSKNLPTVKKVFIDDVGSGGNLLDCVTDEDVVVVAVVKYSTGSDLPANVQA